MLLRICLCFLVALPLAAQVDIAQSPDRIRINISGKPFTEFFIGAETRKPYLHPLRAASGKIVTRHYPMELVEGEPRDHPHHRGLWFTHGDVNGLDFWSNEPSQKGEKGVVVLKKVVDLKSGKKQGLIVTSFNWDDLKGKTLLNEARTMVFYVDPVLRTIDFDITLRAMDTVKFGDTKEGTFAIRVAAPLQEQKGTGTMESANGGLKEKAVWGTQSPWVDYYGEIEGEKLGIAIMDHPTSARHPTYWHSRAYGLFAANVFGLRDFLRDKTKDGSVTLQPGQSLRFRYRVVIHPGDAKSQNIAEMYKKYAAMK
jgi:hypothetical protein